MDLVAADTPSFHDAGSNSTFFRVVLRPGHQYMCSINAPPPRYSFEALLITEFHGAEGFRFTAFHNPGVPEDRCGVYHPGVPEDRCGVGA